MAPSPVFCTVLDDAGGRSSQVCIVRCWNSPQCRLGAEQPRNETIYSGEKITEYKAAPPLPRPFNAWPMDAMANPHSQPYLTKVGAGSTTWLRHDLSRQSLTLTVNTSFLMSEPKCIANPAQRPAHHIADLPPKTHRTIPRKGNASETRRR